MTLEEFKIGIAIEIMRKISNEIELKEIPPTEAFNIQDVDENFFISWKHNRRKAGCFLSQNGFCYIPFKETVYIGDIDNWKAAYKHIIVSLGLDGRLENSHTWQSLMPPTAKQPTEQSKSNE